MATMNSNWKRMRFKRNKVWTAVDKEGRPVLKNGKVLIKYQLDQPHEYWVHPSSIRPLDDAPSNPNSAPPPSRKGRPKAAPRRRAAVLPTADDSTHNLEALQKDTIVVYTDGACSGNPGPAGIGVVMCYQGHRKEISRHIGRATNNIAELEAIKTGLEAVRNRRLPVVLFTDSNYSVGLLTKGWKAKQNQELVRKVRELVKEFMNLRIVKIKGHAGHPENERADRLAVAAVSSSGGNE
jgi:ribonuclease HI